jgi:hypothetical protein
MDMDNSEADVQNALEQRVAYGQICWVLQQMAVFDIPFKTCDEWTDQVAHPACAPPGLCPPAVDPTVATSR